MHEISVTVTNEFGAEAEAKRSFEVVIEKDTIPPIITSTSPHGIVRTADVTISAVVIDEKVTEESGVATVTVSIDGGGEEEMTLDGISATFDATLEDGTHKVKVTATDNSDNKSSATWSFTVDLDTTAPVITAYSPQGIVKNASPTISVSYSDESEIDSVEIEVDNQALNVDVSETYATAKASGLDEGENNVTVRVQDVSGNEATVTWSFTVDLDNTPPTISSVSPQGIVTTDDVTLSVAFNDESGIYRARVSVDGGSLRTMTVNNEETGATYQANNLDEGVHTAEVTVTDASANRNDATYQWSFTVDLDTTPPTIGAVSPQGVVTEEDVMLSVAFNDESGISTARVSVDGGSLQTMTLNSDETGATYEATGLDEGTHTAEVTVTDDSENRNDATYAWSFIVDLDTTPPLITSISPVGMIREAKPIIAVTVTDESGVDEVEVDIEGPVDIKNKDMKLRDTSATYEVKTDLEEGTYNVTVTATDDSANENEAQAQWSFTVEFDTEPPEVNIVSPSAGARITDLTPKIIANYSDKSEIDLNSVVLTVTGEDGSVVSDGTLEKDQNKVSYTVTKDLGYGEYTVELEVADVYANKASIEWSFFVESVTTGIEVPRNFPNPFTIDSGTKIAFVLTKQARVTVNIYDMTSRLIAQPVKDKMMDAGSQKVKWDAMSDNGDELAKGVYFCQVIADGGQKKEQTVIKMALFR
jgi:methionine-rich copper-binding protein CopC